jgi:Methylamine utilisation protein MauE
MTAVSLATRCLLGVVFAVSALSKRDFGAFERSLGRMRLVPGRLLRAVGITVLAAEIGTVVLLAIPGRVFGFALAVIVLGAFTAAIATVLGRGISEPCPCFGPSTASLGWEHLVRNVFLLAVALLGGFASGPAASMGTMVVAAAAGLLVGTLITRFDDLVALLRPLAR